MRKQLGIAFSMVVLSALALLQLGRNPLEGAAAGPPPPEVAGDLARANFAVRIRFGLKDKEPTDWSGTLRPSSGEVLRLEGWRFQVDDTVASNTEWKTMTRIGPIAAKALQTSEGKAAPTATAPLPVGVIAYFDSAKTSTIAVETKQSNFTVNAGDLHFGRPVHFLDGNVSVERVPVSIDLRNVVARGKGKGKGKNAPPTEPEDNDDYPATAVDRNGDVWVSYATYREGKDHIYLRKLALSGAEGFDGKVWGSQIEVTEPGDHFRTACAFDREGRLWIAWASQRNGNWDLYARSYEHGALANEIRLTTDAGPDLHHRMVTDSTGNVWIAWQGFRNGQSEIFVKSFDGKAWNAEQRVSDSNANDWDPSICADKRGNVYVAWDTYDAGNYGVRLRQIGSPPASGGARGGWGPVTRLTNLPTFNAHVSITCDDQDRVWIAWDTAGPNWGKDFGYLNWQNAPGTRLYANRRIRLAMLDGTKLREPVDDVNDGIRDVDPYRELPQIIFDGKGKLWCYYRERYAKNPRIDGWAAQGLWDVYARSYDGGKWSEPVYIPHGVGRNDVRVALARGKEGQVWAAWATDQRAFRNPAPQSVTIAATQVADRRAAEPMQLRDVAAPARINRVLPVHPFEAEDVKRMRSYSIRNDGKTLRIYRGDLHRHTDISGDGVGDGSLMDLYRYALDAARFDFIMVTDHNAGGDQEYPWWRTQKSNDLYFVPNAFIPIYGYERSVAYPNGHRNVLFAQRGVRTLPIAPTEQQGTEGAEKLYIYLRDNNGICTLHTSATDQGTDWRDNDPQLEPIVELFQGYHTSYEYAGAPKTVGEKTDRVHGKYQPAGFVWNALAKGLKLGFQASSDHVSTHMSYACVYADTFSRQGLIDAMKKRHTYAATDNIVLDVRCPTTEGERIMGDIFTTKSRPRLVIKVVGTNEIAKVEIVKNNKFVFVAEPNKKDFTTAWEDNDPTPTESYYYVRVQQKDGQMAWASPLWVTWKP